MKELTIKTKQPYKYVVESSFAGLNEEILSVYGGGRLFVVYDKNTKKLFAKEIRDELCDFELSEIVVPAGEECKSFNVYKKLIDELALRGADRNDMIIAVGGGAVSDLTGFVAATFMRGIKFAIVSTTILSAVDASIGGKTAINTGLGKNLAGAFHSPALVYVNVDCFDSLPPREKESGVGEIVKYAFLDKSFNLSALKDDTEELVYRCADIKRAVVEKDEFELKKRSGRKLLNLGHTIGHALEASKGFALSHGLCVAYGIMKIIDLSADFYSLSPEVVSKMKGLLNAYAFNFDFAVDMRDVKSRILFDKKVSGDKISMILLKDIGELKVENIRISDMWRILK